MQWTFWTQRMSTKPQAQHSRLRTAGNLLVLCDWTLSPVYIQPSRCCRRQLILTEPLSFFKWHNFLAIVSFCSIMSSWRVLFSHTERPACILKCTLIWSKHHINRCLVFDRSANNNPHMLQTWSSLLISSVKKVRRGIHV